MKSRVILRILLNFIILIVLASSVNATTITLYPSFQYSSVKYLDISTGNYVYDYGTYDLGRLNGWVSSNSDEDIYRSGWGFVLSDIPDVSRINRAKLIGYIQPWGFSYQGRLVGIPYNSNISNPETLWNAVGNSTVIYLDEIDYNQNFNEESEELRDVIESNLGVNIIKIGLLSLDEDQNESVGYLNNFHIEVDYSVPINVTIETNPVGLQFYVDGENYTFTHTFEWFAGDEHTIGTTTPQTYNGKNYSFQNWSDGGAIEHIINPTSNQTITANFTELLHIIVKNRRDGGDVKVDNVQYPSGAEFDFIKGSTHNFEAWEQNYGGYSMVFKPGEKKWDTPDGPFYTALIENHAVENAGTYEAQLWRVCNFTADNYFLNGGSGGSIIVNTVPQNAPYSSTNLEEDQIIFEAPTQDQTVNGRPVTYNFVFWENGSTQNPRTLASTTNFNVTASYKGHLVSNSDRATAYNNGRRLMRDNQGNLHLVYEDHGQIYYTSYDAGSGEWSKELLLSNVNYENTLPSISKAVYSSDEKGKTIFAVVWDNKIGDEHRVALRYKRGSQWSIIYCHSTQYPQFLYPVITPGNISEGDKFYIAYDTGAQLNLMYFDYSENKYGGKRKITGTDAGSAYPSISSEPEPVEDGDSGPPPPPPDKENIFISWQQSEKIMYTYYDGNNFSEPEEISSPLISGSSNTNPCIGYDRYGVVNIVWQHFDGESGTDVQHRRGDGEGGNWEPIRQFGCGGCHHLTLPSVGAFSGSGSAELAAGAQTAGFINFFTFDGSQWEQTGEYYPGTNSALNERGSELYSVWTDDSEGLPYLIRQHPLTGSGENITDWEAVAYRKQMFSLSKLSGFNLRGEVSLKIGDLKVLSSSGARRWSFLPLSDSLSPGCFQQTVPLTVTPQMQQVTIHYQVKVSDYQPGQVLPPTPLFRVQFFNGQSGQPLAVLHQLPFSALGAGQLNLKDSLVIDLSPFVGREISLSMENIYNLSGSGTEPPEQIDIVEFRHSAPLKRSALNKTAALNNKQQPIPAKYALHPNYPNPFNPATTIAFDLPEKRFVRLEVYNVRGQLVSRLVEKELPAGFHRVSWNGRDRRGNALSSGVYIYRLKAGSFVETRKMILMR